MAIKDKVERKLVEIAAGKAIKDIRANPAAGIAGLLGKAQELGGSRLPPELIAEAGRLLRDPEGPYTKLLVRVLRQTEQEKLLGFCLNLGFNALGDGAQSIARVREKYGYAVPWLMGVSFGAGSVMTAQRTAALVAEGKKLGIYTYALSHSSGDVCAMLPVIEKHDDCAFVLLAGGEALSDSAVARLSRYRNILVLVSADTPACETACLRLRSARLLYGVFAGYGDDLTPEAGKALIETLAPAQPACILLRPAAAAGESGRRAAADFALKFREKPLSDVLVAALPGDEGLMTQQIPGCGRAVTVDAEGQLSSSGRCFAGAEFNVTKTPLRELFQTAFPTR